ncbi:hypothetical protein STEG23_035475, partial [Scotinomys teguina]
PYLKKRVMSIYVTGLLRLIRQNRKALQWSCVLTPTTTPSSSSKIMRIIHLQLTIQALQDELRTQRDLNHLLQQESGNRGAEHFTIELTEENFRRLQAEHDRQAKELFLLRKTLEEMELRIETQKQTLNARDESIKKLLEMLQSKGLPSKSLEDDNERTRRMAEAESQVSHLEVILDQKEKENMHLREVRASVSLPKASL